MRKQIQKLLFPVLASFVFSAAVANTIASPQQPTTEASGIVEQGKFTLHKFEQAIGQENYEIRRDGDSVVVKMDFKFTDRGTPVPLSATTAVLLDDALLVIVSLPVVAPVAVGSNCRLNVAV